MKNIFRQVVVLGAALVLVVPVAVFAAGGAFTDDDESIFEADIEWLAGAGVTLGCNPPANDNFCPEGGVTRGQMAAFMRRFAQYIDAEDGTVANADDAARLGGKDKTEFQPALFAFESNPLFSVNSNGNFTVVSASVTPTDIVCAVGSPQAGILIRASGFVSLLSTGESATLFLHENGIQLSGTIRQVTESNGSFAMEWLFSSGGGMETFSLGGTEGGGDLYSVVDAQITLEVVQDTRCEGFVFIPLPAPSAAVDPEAGSE